MQLTEKHQNQIVKNEGFKVLKIKYDDDSSVIRHLFLKQFTLNFHKNLNNERLKPENRTLLIINVPPFINEHHIRFLFEKCGKITRIYFQEKPSLSSASTIYNKIKYLEDKDLSENQTANIPSVTEYFKHEHEIVSYKVCYVVYNKLIGLLNAIQMTETENIYILRPNEKQQQCSTNSHWFTGVKLWQKNYNDSVIAPHELKKVAESFIEEHRKRVQEQEQLEKDMVQNAAKSNEQGWVTVNRKLRCNRRALRNDQYHDQMIEKKYKDREMKRKIEEQQFDEQIEQIVEKAIKKKKSKKEFNF